MSDTFPDHEAELDAEGIPAIEDQPPGQAETGEIVEGMVPPRDHPQAVDEHGITAAEARVDEPISDRVLREEPDFGADGHEDTVGQLVEPDSDLGELDATPEAVASDVGAGGTAQSAEEAAMHVTEEP